MAVQWTADLAVGVPQIDGQHRELFKKLNDLLEACQQRQGKEMVGTVLGFLGRYVVEHFQAEEALMASVQYPALVTHRGHHKSFLKSFGDLQKAFTAEGPGPHIVIQTNQVVLQWLNGHIRTIDKAFGEFLTSRH
jgi:hemerythrin